MDNYSFPSRVRAMKVILLFHYICQNMFILFQDKIKKKALLWYLGFYYICDWIYGNCFKSHIGSYEIIGWVGVWNEALSSLWMLGLLKQAAKLDIASPDTCQFLKLPFEPFEPFTPPWIHPCYNQPQVSRLKFRLETNSTVVWLYAGCVSLILPDVWFETVSLDWITYTWSD